MLGTAGEVQNLEFYHSYSAQAAWGLHAMSFEDDEDEMFTGIQHNWLLKRWNLPSAQANVYTGLGAGLAGELSNGALPAGIGFFRADYETRLIYTAFCAQGILAHFKKHPAISQVHVDLTRKIVLLEERKGKSITDKEINEQIKKSGFELLKVERVKESFETAKIVGTG